MKRVHFASIIILLSVPMLAQESFFVQTETRYWDNANAYNGYTLFGTRGQSYLIDMEGRVAHSWNLGTNPRFTAHGTLLDAVGGDPSKSNSWRELDWNGTIVWQYTEKRTGYWPHHDFDCIYNPKLGDTTFLYIANKDLTAAQCLAAGCDPKNEYTGAQMDVIVEVDRKGNIIWEWSFFDHVVQDIDASKPTYGVIKNTPGRIDINLPGMPVRKDWLHCNSLDYNEKKDLIVINSVQGECYVIDHGNTFVAGKPDSSIARAASSAGDFAAILRAMHREIHRPCWRTGPRPPRDTSRWEGPTTSSGFVPASAARATSSCSTTRKTFSN